MAALSRMPRLAPLQMGSKLIAVSQCTAKIRGAKELAADALPVTQSPNIVTLHRQTALLSRLHR